MKELICQLCFFSLDTLYIYFWFFLSTLMFMLLCVDFVTIFLTIQKQHHHHWSLIQFNMKQFYKSVSISNSKYKHCKIYPFRQYFWKKFLVFLYLVQNKIISFVFLIYLHFFWFFNFIGLLRFFKKKKKNYTLTKKIQIISM